jgi:L-aspartate oxidase
MSEALRGEGARLINNAGEAFMDRYEPAGDLASRDLVSRAMVREAERTGSPVCLTLAHLAPEFVRQRFPTIARACAEVGLDLARDPIPVSPAAHYIMGGVETDLDGRTSLPGLFAAGEVACTGVHGANRLASNSLLEGLVFGARAAQAMKGAQADAALFDSNVVDDFLESDAADGGNVPSAHEVRDLMWRHVGVLRTESTLEQAVVELQTWVGAIAARQRAGAYDQELRRIGSLATAGFLFARAALRRTESRGAHFRADFPFRDDLHWKKRIAERIHGH